MYEGLKKLIIEDQVEVHPERVSPSCLNDCVCMQSCHKYFSDDGRSAISDVIEAVKKNSVWFCGHCTLQIHDGTQSSIECGSCLSWFHFKWVGLKEGVKKAWFCRACFLNS